MEKLKDLNKMKSSISEYIEEFGLSTFISKTIYHFYYNNYSWLGSKIAKHNENLIKTILRNNITNSINNEELENLYVNPKVSENSVIWIMWWQGFEKMPRLISKCITNIRKLNYNHKVIVITKDNYKKFVKINPIILQKLQRGEISVTHLSDIIRVNLLYIYGGIWMDATILAMKPLPDFIFSQDFFTIKTGHYTNDPSHGLWTTFLMESLCGSTLMKYLVKSFNIYCKKYRNWIDYILFDYFIRILYEDNKEIYAQINAVPVNNKDVFKLRNYLNSDIKNVNFIGNDTYLFKLSYKDNLIDQTPLGKTTLYSKIINDQFDGLHNQ